MLRNSSSETRSLGWVRAGATVAISAMALTLLSATPVFAIPIADVPANTADWASTPYSPLQPDQIAVLNNAAVLTFDGADGGLNASGDVGTGFTMVQPSTSDPQWYQPADLSVSGGKLNITAAKGIAYLHNDPAVSNVAHSGLAIRIPTSCVLSSLARPEQTVTHPTQCKHGRH